jgi:hypothetical protein
MDSSVFQGQSQTFPLISEVISLKCWLHESAENDFPEL